MFDTLRNTSLLVALAFGSGACAFEHGFQADPATSPSDVRGYVHAEVWTPAFLYLFPLFPDNDERRALELAERKAVELGGDGLRDVRIHTETHMPFFWVAGWIEHHVSGAAVVER